MADKRLMSGDYDDGLERGEEVFGALLPGIDLSFFGPLWRTIVASQLIAANLELISRQYDLGIGDVSVLTAIRTAGDRPVRAADLARSQFVTSSGMTTRIDALVRHGLVERRPMPFDRRAASLVITVEGERVADAAVAQIATQSTFVRAFKRLSQGERDMLNGIMQQVLLELERHHTGP